MSLTPFKLPKSSGCERRLSAGGNGNDVCQYKDGWQIIPGNSMNRLYMRFRNACTNDGPTPQNNLRLIDDELVAVPSQVGYTIDIEQLSNN
jgi:hypothetical protein